MSYICTFDARCLTLIAGKSRHTCALKCLFTVSFNDIFFCCSLIDSLLDCLQSNTASCDDDTQSRVDVLAYTLTKLRVFCSNQCEFEYFKLLVTYKFIYTLKTPLLRENRGMQSEGCRLTEKASNFQRIELRRLPRDLKNGSGTDW